MRLSLSAPPWRLACWRGSGLAALRHVSRVQRPTALRSARQQGPTAAAGSSSSSSSGQPGSEAEGQQVAFVSAQPNQEQQRQLWQQAYSQVLAFQQAHGRLPRTNATKAGPLLEGERRLGRWCVLQHRRKDGSKSPALSADEKATLQAIPGWEWGRARPTRKDWWLRLQDVEAFVAQHDRLPRTSAGESSPFLLGERQLGQWCDNQRLRYRGQRGPLLSPEEEAALAAIPRWFRDQRDLWEQQCQQVVAFQQQYGRLPRQQGSGSQPLVEDEGQLGEWCSRQRQHYKGRLQPPLSPGDVAALSAIPGWFWDQQEDYWEQQCQQVVAFQQQNGRLPRREGSKAQPLVENEGQLGGWCATQRRRYKGRVQQSLTPAQEAALEAIPGWFWQKRHKKGP